MHSTFKRAGVALLSFALVAKVGLADPYKDKLRKLDASDASGDRVIFIGLCAGLLVISGLFTARLVETLDGPKLDQTAIQNISQKVELNDGKYVLSDGVVFDSVSAAPLAKEADSILGWRGRLVISTKRNLFVYLKDPVTHTGWLYSLFPSEECPEEIKDLKFHPDTLVVNTASSRRWIFSAPANELIKTEWGSTIVDRESGTRYPAEVTVGDAPLELQPEK